MDEREHQLTGGNVSTGLVRVGDTVRRPAGPWTPSVHALLCQLTEVGFEGSPRSFGVDDQGRHVVEWIDGDVTHPYRSLGNSDPSLEVVGRLIRSFHDAVSGFTPPPDAHWNVVMKPDATDMIVHHDMASWNFVHGAGRVVFIDWDNAGPGTALWDLALAAISFADLAPGGDAAAVGRRLRALADGYGLGEVERVRLVEMLPVRSGAMLNLLQQGNRSGVQPWARLWHEGHGTSWEQITGYAADHQDDLVAAVLA